MMMKIMMTMMMIMMNDDDDALGSNNVCICASLGMQAYLYFAHPVHHGFRSWAFCVTCESQFWMKVVLCTLGSNNVCICASLGTQAYLYV